MTNDESVAIAGQLVALLAPYSSEDRMRLIKASLVLLGEGTPIKLSNAELGDGAGSDDIDGYPPKVQLWMKKQGVTAEQLSHAFHIKDGHAEVLLSKMPGSSKKLQVLNAYVFTGVGSFLTSGEPAFDDKTARELCESSGCYDHTNHTKYLGEKGDKLSGSKDKGWILTGPGLKHGASLIKELADND